MNLNGPSAYPAPCRPLRGLWLRPHRAFLLARSLRTLERSERVISSAVSNGPQDRPRRKSSMLSAMPESTSGLYEDVILRFFTAASIKACSWPYSIAMVTVLDTAPSIVSTTGIALPGGALSGT